MICYLCFTNDFLVKSCDMFDVLEKGSNFLENTCVTNENNYLTTSF